MHIPDGFLATNTWLPTWIISIGAIGFCLRKTSQILKDRMVPLMGVVAAFIFAAQMVNFPVIGGTSGHLLGAVLAVVLLGPCPGAIVIAVVLAAQCFIFQDGGITALGANILNMSFVGAMGGYLVYNFIRKLIKNNNGILIAAAIAGWFSVVMAAAMCAAELAFSGTWSLSLVLPAMIGIHALIGIGEAIITCLVVGFVLKVRPDLVWNNK